MPASGENPKLEANGISPVIVSDKLNIAKSGVHRSAGHSRASSSDQISVCLDFFCFALFK